MKLKISLVTLEHTMKMTQVKLKTDKDHQW